MRRLTLIRYGVLILMRDVLIPGAALYVIAFQWSNLELWHAPLLAGMLGTPLVARGESPPEIERAG